MTTASTARQRRRSYNAKPALVHLRTVDPVLGELIDTFGPCEIDFRLGTDTFSALARAVVFQQLSGKAASAIFARLCAWGASEGASGEECPAPQVILASAVGALRAVGMSVAKERSLRDMAERAVNGTLPAMAELAVMDDELVIERLTAVRSVGRWTAPRRCSSR